MQAVKKEAEEKDEIVALENLEKRIGNLEQRVNTLEVKNMPMKLSHKKLKRRQEKPKKIQVPPKKWTCKHGDTWEGHTPIGLCGCFYRKELHA